MTTADSPCINEDRRSATHTVQARYWWGWGPKVSLCDPCTAAMVRAVALRARASSFAVQLWIDERRFRHPALARSVRASA